MITRYEDMFGTPEKTIVTVRHIISHVQLCGKMQMRGHDFDCDLCAARWACGVYDTSAIKHLKEEIEID